MINFWLFLVLAPLLYTSALLALAATITILILLYRYFFRFRADENERNKIKPMFRKAIKLLLISAALYILIATILQS